MPSETASLANSMAWSTFSNWMATFACSTRHIILIGLFSTGISACNLFNWSITSFGFELAFAKSISSLFRLDRFSKIMSLIQSELRTSVQKPTLSGSFSFFIFCSKMDRTFPYCFNPLWTASLRLIIRSRISSALWWSRFFGNFFSARFRCCSAPIRSSSLNSWPAWTWKYLQNYTTLNYINSEHSFTWPRMNCAALRIRWLLNSIYHIFTFTLVIMLPHWCYWHTSNVLRKGIVQFWIYSCVKFGVNNFQFCCISKTRTWSSFGMLLKNF